MPGDDRHHRVDPTVVGRGEQADPTAVRRAGEPDPRVAGRVELDLGPRGEQVDELADVGHLVVRGGERDLPGRAAEAAGRVGEHDVAVPGQVGRVVAQVVL